MTRNLGDLKTDDLRQIVREYDDWARTATVPDDAKLREVALRYGKNPHFSMYAASAEAFRELLNRMGLQEMPDKKYIFVRVGGVYPEDATVNGVEDENGDLMPFLANECWAVYIDIETGVVQGWPKGTKAHVHYKVCDRGTYHITDDVGVRIAEYRGDYVPGFMYPDTDGYGDYVILDILEDGKIQGWKAPEFDDEWWDFIQ